ncbi:RNA-directed DNA polymerase, eukaryota [Tanacetum coccineum]
MDRLASHGIDLISMMHKKIGNGSNTSFWKDRWRGEQRLKEVFPRIYALEVNKHISVAFKFEQTSLSSSLRRMPRSGIESEQWDHLLDSLEGVMLSPSEDRWSWDLNGSGEFSVASARRYIDNNRLPDISSKTRWIKEVPIKVNVHAWKVRINGLPTRWNISRRGIDIPSILCPLCETGVESSKHLFFNCSVVRAIFRRVCIWWDVSYMELDSFDEWISWITNLRLPSKHKRLLEGVCYGLWWFIWAFRNKKIFGVVPSSKANIFDDLVLSVFLICVSKAHDKGRQELMCQLYGQVKWIEDRIPIKMKAADYGQVKWIEDRIPRTTWSMVPIDYDKHAYWGRYHWVIWKRFGRRQGDVLIPVSRSEVRELRSKTLKICYFFLFKLAVKSYQKKINLTRPDTTRPDLRKMTPYTGYPDVQGIIYQDKLSRNRLMRTDELHKFSDGTLNHVRTTLNDIATEIQMDYFSKRRWSLQDKRRARVMISAIDRKLRDRRLMRSLEKCVGGRSYGGDLRLLERTI